MYIAYEIHRVGDFVDEHGDEETIRLQPNADIEYLKKTHGLVHVYWTLYGRKKLRTGVVVAEAVDDRPTKAMAVNLYLMITGNFITCPDDNEPMLNLSAEKKPIKGRMEYDLVIKCSGGEQVDVLTTDDLVKALELRDELNGEKEGVPFSVLYETCRAKVVNSQFGRWVEMCWGNVEETERPAYVNQSGPF